MLFVEGGVKMIGLFSSCRNKKIIGEQGGIESICNLIKNNHSGKVRTSLATKM